MQGTNIMKKSVTFISTNLLRSLYGKELVLPLAATHIAERSVIGHVPGDKGDLIHQVLVLNNLTPKEDICFLLYYYVAQL